MTNTASTEVQDEILKIIEKAKNLLKNKDTPLYELANISPEKIENLYKKAYAFYSAERYQQAAELFKTLVLYNHQDPNSWMGFAASYQMLKNYEKSIDGYSKAFRLDRQDPSPLIHLFECYFDMQDYPRAIASLESVILIIKDSPEYSDVKIQAESLKEILNKNISDKTSPTLMPF
ncbi:MAG: SycD/LcrH family type III secretion system chaperone [Chthoniobacterales bacterium]